MNATNDALIPTYTSTTLDHLGLVAGMVDELGLVEKIDDLIPQDFSQRQISLGVAVKAMILNGLGFAHRALYLMPHFFHDKPVERLLGSGVTAEHLNDDTLGRALDAIHAFGVETFYYLMASSVLHNTDMLMTVPERFARRHNLHHVDLPVSDVPALETHLYWHESTDQDPANRWMREQMIELAQQITAQERAEQGA